MINFTLILLLFLLTEFATPAQAQDVEHVSLITTPIILLKGDNVISQGTGFYYALVKEKVQIIMC
jgi:hypothetical protein